MNAAYIIILIALWVIFWLIPLVSIFRSSEGDYRQPSDRVLWFILVFFLPLLGGLIYAMNRWAKAVDRHALSRRSYTPRI